MLSVCLFELMLYVPFNTLSAMSGGFLVEPVMRIRLNVLLNDTTRTVTPVRLEPATSQHSARNQFEKSEYEQVLA